MKPYFIIITMFFSSTFAMENEVTFASYLRYVHAFNLLQLDMSTVQRKIKRPLTMAETEDLLKPYDQYIPINTLFKILSNQARLTREYMLSQATKARL